VTQTHDQIVACRRGDFETRGQRLALDDERMIASGFELLRQPAKERAPVVFDLRRLAVHGHGRAHDAPAENFADSLMPEADAEHGNPPREMLDGRARDARVFRLARPRRD
jgi:hypothetical protein